MYLRAASTFFSLSFSDPHLPPRGTRKLSSALQFPMDTLLLSLPVQDKARSFRCAMTTVSAAGPLVSSPHPPLSPEGWVVFLVHTIGSY